MRRRNVDGGRHGAFDTRGSRCGGFYVDGSIGYVDDVPCDGVVYSDAVSSGGGRLIVEADSPYGNNTSRHRGYLYR